jgi:hypothetical protein
MQKTLLKFAPQAMVLAVALYWSWPALKIAFPRIAAGSSTAESKKPVGKAFAAVVLSPKFLPFPKRVPFLSADYRPKNAKLAKSGKGGKTLDTAAKVAAIRDSGLVLSGTCIMGDKRMAIINGQVYKEKDAIPQPGEETPSCFITNILPHRVLLSYQGEIVQLGYVNVAAKPAAAKNPEKPAK